MSVKYQMTERGMQSMYSLAWPQRGLRTASDPIFSGHGQEAEELDSDTLLLETTVVAPGRIAPLEDAVRVQAERERALARREMDLLRLGYLGF